MNKNSKEIIKYKREEVLVCWHEVSCPGNFTTEELSIRKYEF